MGAPIKKAFTQRDYDRIRRLVAKGYTRQSIAHEFGMSVTTFYRWIEKDGKLKEALEVGKQQDCQLMLNKCRSKALEGSYQHMAGYMRVIHQIDLSGDSERSRGTGQIVINLNLGDASQSKAGELIEHELDKLE